MSCHVMSCHVISYHITPCFVIIHTGGEKTAVTGCDRVRGERVRDRGAKRKRSQTIDRRTKKSLHLNNSISTHSVLFAFCSLHRYTVLHYTHTHTHTHTCLCTYVCPRSRVHRRRGLLSLHIHRTALIKKKKANTEDPLTYPLALHLSLVRSFIYIRLYLPYHDFSICTVIDCILTLVLLNQSFCPYFPLYFHIYISFSLLTIASVRKREDDIVFFILP